MRRHHGGTAPHGGKRLPRLRLPVETLFSDLPRLSLSEFHTKLCRSGCELYQTRLNLRQPYPTGARLRLYGADGTFFALGEVRNYPDGTAIKMIKLFVL